MTYHEQIERTVCASTWLGTWPITMNIISQETDTDRFFPSFKSTTKNLRKRCSERIQQSNFKWSIRQSRNVLLSVDLLQPLIESMILEFSNNKQMSCCTTASADIRFFYTFKCAKYQDKWRTVDIMDQLGLVASPDEFSKTKRKTWVNNTVINIQAKTDE